MKNKARKPGNQSGFLATIERVGNKMPHPAILFLYLIVIVLVLSFVLSLANVTEQHPSTVETVYVNNMMRI